METAYGVYINTTSAPFVKQIFDLEKPYETRTKDMLRHLVGKRVYIIETGHGTPMIMGRVTITCAKLVAYDDVQMRKDAKIIGTPYDIALGGAKWFYKLENIERLPPVPAPESRVNRGRSWTTWERKC